MNTLNYDTEKVFDYFKQICAIPHGSTNMDAISDFCVKFAKDNNLKFIQDGAKNVIIFKPGTAGFENSAPLILQGHIDMVCQKTEDSPIDFEKDGLDVYEDNGFLKARGTTLGADDGIAVAMVMAILASDNIPHPPIEAVFTTDEEIGMLGAEALDTSVLKGRRMVNIDSEEADTLTVSCAGGSDFKAYLPLSRQKVNKTKVTLSLKGLKGGHSGTEIDKGRVNANILMGRILNGAAAKCDFDIISVDGGDKANAIPTSCTAHLAADNAEELMKAAENYYAVVKDEIKERESDCTLDITVGDSGEYAVFDKAARDKFLYMLLIIPNGVVDMSLEIKGLVETSLNLGIVSTFEDKVLIYSSVRSNKKTALDFMLDKMMIFAQYHGCSTEISGRYEPWEYNDKSFLQEAYIAEYEKKTGKKPNVSAIHAGLECAVFSRKIEALDCISIGPDMTGVHTVNETLDINSVKEIYSILCELLKKCQ